MKKTYIKPVLIDLSIEGMTGIGAGIMASSCNGGLIYAYASAECALVGNLASSSCGGGGFASSSCGNGNAPTVSGVVCITLGSSAGSACDSGTTAAGSKGVCALQGQTAAAACHSGSSASSVPYCNFGSSPSTCLHGDTDTFTS
jgi:hypothetical protein